MRRYPFTLEWEVEGGTAIHYSLSTGKRTKKKVVYVSDVVVANDMEYKKQIYEIPRSKGFIQWVTK